MSDLTEVEIFDCLTDNFKKAIQHCEDLAVKPAKGPTYSTLRNELKLIEGASRQAAHWREDSRWLQIGLLVSEAHKRAGNWLRAKQPAKLFLLLAKALIVAQANAEDIRTRATGRRGAILPDVMPGPHRDTRPVGWRASDGGILLPN
ncbi:hypothetical protein FHT86_002159 [Rhizobium sp. BK313]|uniref:hypothetical protein n=1 Tax=Rhizobium sp. BK313 TaxID=2587081 RepID=UPI001619F002|nr:hypothetical protein [Rhizobium sp. BK313]MBB3453903.1 hypothetical protein [Rhizobium sp. BK313]